VGCWGQGWWGVSVWLSIDSSHNPESSQRTVQQTLYCYRNKLQASKVSYMIQACYLHA
jgi:hypothetical protein